MFPVPPLKGSFSTGLVAVGWYSFEPVYRGCIAYCASGSHVVCSVFLLLLQGEGRIVGTHVRISFHFISRYLTQTCLGPAPISILFCHSWVFGPSKWLRNRFPDNARLFERHSRSLTHFRFPSGVIWLSPSYPQHDSRQVGLRAKLEAVLEHQEAAEARLKWRRSA